MKCEGKCHLDKVMKEDSKRGKDNSAIRELSEISNCICYPGESLRSPDIKKPDLISSYLIIELKERALSFFHPPSEILCFQAFLPELC